MLRRNRVPTLKMLCIRKIAFPATAEYRFKIVSKELQERREVKNLPFSSYQKFFNERTNFLKSFKQKYRGMKQMSFGDISSSVESIVNGWIRLSAYYQTSLEEWQDVSHFFSAKSITTLDFLHEGALLRNGLNFQKHAHIIPHTTSPQSVYPMTYKGLLDILNHTDNMDALKNLYINFDFSQFKLAGAGRFEFERTFRFVNLYKLVVRGPAADDSLLSAIGFWCKTLHYLDIRDTSVTEHGILLLLLKSPKKDGKKFDLVPDYPHVPDLLTDLTKTLEYLDMSTVQKQGELLYQDRIVRMALPRLRETLKRVFFLPPGRNFYTSRSVADEELKIRVLRNTAFSFLRSRVFEAFSHMITEAHKRFQYSESITAMEIRRDFVDDECVVLFLHECLVVLEFRLANLNIVSVLCHTKSDFNFLPVDVLCRVMPNLKEIKASLDGILTSPNASFQKLERLTIPMVKNKKTLISIVKRSRRLVYLEVGEMRDNSNAATLCDGDIYDMVLPTKTDDGVASHGYLEVFRIHFKNQITLSPGLRDLIKFCPLLRIVGDLSRWQISNTSLQDFAAQLRYHNCDIIYEHNTMLYHTSTPCKEFFR